MPRRQLVMSNANDSDWEFEISCVKGIPHANYRTIDDIPHFTETGFTKVRVPKQLYQRLLNFYLDDEVTKTKEFDPKKPNHLSDYIWSDQVEYPAHLKLLPQNIVSYIFNGLMDIHRQWAGVEIEPTYCYGIREYSRGSVLKKHRDLIQTNVISSIINVAQEVEEPWALQIEDHSGHHHEVYMEPGEMVLYESATVMHGRENPLIGDSYANIFCHYVNLEIADSTKTDPV